LGKREGEKRKGVREERGGKGGRERGSRRGRGKGEGNVWR